MCFEPPYLQGTGTKQTRGVVECQRHGKREVLTPRSPPPPHPPTPPSPAPLPTSSSSLSSLLFFSECTANCKTCQGNFCSVCEQGHALYKGSGRFGKGRCLRKCPKGYKTGVNPSGGEKCVRCKYHNLCSIYLKTAVTRYQAPIYWPL